MSENTIINSSGSQTLFGNPSSETPFRTLDGAHLGLEYVPGGGLHDRLAILPERCEVQIVRIELATGSDVGDQFEQFYPNREALK